MAATLALHSSWAYVPDDIIIFEQRSKGRNALSEWVCVCVRWSTQFEQKAKWRQKFNWRQPNVTHSPSSFICALARLAHKTHVRLIILWCSSSGSGGGHGAMRPLFAIAHRFLRSYRFYRLESIAYSRIDCVCEMCASCLYETPNCARHSPTLNANRWATASSVEWRWRNILLGVFQSIFVSSAFHFEAASTHRTAHWRDFFIYFFFAAAAAVVVDGCTKANKEKRWNVKRKPKKAKKKKFVKKKAIRIHANRETWPGTGFVDWAHGINADFLLFLFPFTFNMQIVLLACA